MSRIALGLMRIANKTPKEVEQLIKESLKLGINFFDLADIYGRGKCESLVGEVLKNNPTLREKMYIQSKVGIAYETIGYDNSYDYIINHTKKILERLNTSYLDCLLIHRPDVFLDAKEIYDAVTYLKSNGLIKDFGVSNFNTEEIKYLKDYKIDVKYNQVSLGVGNTTMIDQIMYTNVPKTHASKESDDLFFYLKRKNITIQTWSPFQYGFFEGSIFDTEKYPLINEVLDKFAKQYNTSKCAIATAFLLKLDNNLIVITGSTNISHIKEALDGELINLSKADWYAIYKGCGHILP